LRESEQPQHPCSYARIRTVKSTSSTTQETTTSGFLNILKWIGLDLTAPDSSSPLQIGIYALLIFFPIALIIKFADISGPWLFITSALAIVPLAKILSSATEQLVVRVGPGLGGL